MVHESDAAKALVGVVKAMDAVLDGNDVSRFFSLSDASGGGHLPDFFGAVAAAALDQIMCERRLEVGPCAFM